MAKGKGGGPSRGKHQKASKKGAGHRTGVGPTSKKTPSQQRRAASQASASAQALSVIQKQKQQELQKKQSLEATRLNLSDKARRLLAEAAAVQAEQFKRTDAAALAAVKAAEEALAELTATELFFPAEAEALRKAQEKFIQQKSQAAFDALKAEQEAMMQEIAKRKAEADAKLHISQNLQQKYLDDLMEFAKKSIEINTQKEDDKIKTIQEKMVEQRQEIKDSLDDFFKDTTEGIGKFFEPMTGIFMMLGDTFERWINPTPEDMIKNARNTVEAAKFLLKAGGVGIDAEAFSVEKVQKEIAGK